MMDELTPERQAEIDKQSGEKLTFVLQEYWRLRNGKARFMRCPYCSTGNTMRRNWPGGKLCCRRFAQAFKAILDRQEKIDAGMKERITEKLLAH